jgi:dienelactone hydrolase
MPNTHCLPTGALGTNELAVPPIIGYAGIPAGGVGHGNIRGVVVWLHGLRGPGSAYPATTPVDTGGILPGYFATFTNALITDGWVVLAPIYAEDGFATANPTKGLYNDINSDTGGGSRYLAQMLHWWDHVVAYIKATYGNLPIVPFGMSWGGWHALQIAANRQSTVAAYGCHCPSNVMDVVSTTVTPGYDFTALANQARGLDVFSTALNSVTVPGIIGYGTSDSLVGYSGSTVGSTSNGGIVSNITAWSSPSAGVIKVADYTQFTVGPAALITGPGGKWANIKFTGVSTSGLTGCTYVAGSAGYTLSTGDTVQQAGTVQLIGAQQAAQPTHPVTANSTTNNHAFLLADSATYVSWFTGTVDPIAPKVY